MSDASSFYISGAFLLGAAVTAACTSQFSKQESSKSLLRQQQKRDSKFTNINDLDVLKQRLVEIDGTLQEGAGSIKEGIEGCIGNTPLIKIKSLSDYTGCEILAKAEVRAQVSPV